MCSGPSLQENKNNSRKDTGRRAVPPTAPGCPPVSGLLKSDAQPADLRDSGNCCEHQDALDWLAFIQKQLGDVGMKTTIRAMKWPDMEKAGEAGELELWLTGYSKDVVSNHLAYFGPNGAWNYGNYSNPEYEELLSSAGRAGGEEKRRLFMKMQEIFNEELPGIPIWNITSFVLVKPQFCGVVEQFSDQHFAYLNENNIYMCEGATGTVSVRPGAPASLEHPGYVLGDQ